MAKTTSTGPEPLSLFNAQQPMPPQTVSRADSTRFRRRSRAMPQIATTKAEVLQPGQKLRLPPERR